VTSLSARSLHIAHKFSFILVTLVSGTLLLAQAPDLATAPVRRDVDAIALLRLSLVKMGALAAANRDTVATGTFLNLRTGASSPLTIKTSGTDSLRNEVGTDFVFIRNGSSGKTRYGGKDHKLPAHSVAYKRPEHLPALLLMSEVESPNLSCVMLGLESVNGIATSHIRLSLVPQDGSSPIAEDLMSETHVWIDERGLVIKARVFNFSPQLLENRSPVDLYYSDYRQVEGFLVPFHVVREVDRQKDADITFTSIVLNANLSPADFQ